MESQSRWAGLFPALWTPTDGQGDLLEAEISGQVRYLREAGADGVMVLGSTGEFVQMEVRERIEVLRVVSEAAAGWPVIANCSDVSPRRVAELGAAARACGAAAISLLPPWFFASAQADVAEFMIRGAEAAGLPLLVYNFPERTGIRLSLETVAAVCDRVPVVALKQSGAEFGYHRELAALAAEKKFVLITGADTKIPEAFALGATGVVSGLSNAVPDLVVASLRAARTGNAAAATAASDRVKQFASTLAGLEFPLDVAAAMEARGRATGVLKPWLSAATRETFTRVVGKARGALKALGVA